METIADKRLRAFPLQLSLDAIAGALLLMAALAILLAGMRAAAFNPYPALVDFYPREFNERGAYQFTRPQASLFWARPLPTGAHLTLTIQSPAPLPPRELRLSVRDNELLRLPVGPELRTVRLLLPPGDPALAGYALDLSTAEARARGDPRALGLLVTEARLAAPQPAPPLGPYALATVGIVAVALLLASLSLGWATAGLAAMLLALLFRADASRFWMYTAVLCAALLAMRIALPRPVMDRAERRRPWPPDAWATAAVVFGFTAFIGGYALANHHAFGTNGYDLGLYDQTFWLVSRMLPNYSTGAGINMVGSHANLMIFPLATLYWLVPDVRALLLLQTLAVGLAAVPLYLLGRDSGQPWLGVAVGLAYLAHPAVQNMALFDFHVDTIAATALIVALWASEARRWRLMLACCAIVVLCKENFAITVAWLGMWQLARRRWRLGTALIIGSVAWFLFATQLLVPALIGHDESLHVSRFARYGDSVPAIILFVLTNPLAVLPDLFPPGADQYLFKLLLPFALLPLLSPYTILAAPALAINLLSNFDGQRSFNFHYNSLIVAVLAVAALDAARHIAQWLGSAGHARRTAVAGWALAALLLGAAWYSQGSTLLRRDTIANYVTRDEELRYRRAYILSLIPPEAGVSAQSNLHPQLTHRQQIFIYPNPFIRADFYHPEALPFAPQIDYVVLDTRRIGPSSVSIDDQARLVDELEERGLYRRAASLGGLVLLERVPGRPAGCYGPGWAAEECLP
ncbi:MAG: hypothetical protein OHK0015_42500 [Chloroflexi bacterium OHK40]